MKSYFALVLAIGAESAAMGEPSLPRQTADGHAHAAALLSRPQPRDARLFRAARTAPVDAELIDGHASAAALLRRPDSRSAAAPALTRAPRVRTPADGQTMAAAALLSRPRTI